MIAVFRQAESEEENRHFPGLLHRDDGTDGTPFTDERRFVAEPRLGGTPHTFDVWSLEAALEGMQHAFPFDLHAGIELRHILFEQSKDLFRRLIGYETHADLELTMAGDDCFYARAMIAAGQAVDLKCRRRPDPARHFGGIVCPERVKSIGLLEALDLKSRLKKALDLLPRRLDDISVEPRDFHFAGFGVHTGLCDLHQLRQRISRSAARDTGMGVLAAGSQGQPGAEQTTQSIGHGRLSFGDPDRIRDDDRIGSRNRSTVFETGGKMRAANLLFELPKKPDINRHALFDCQAGTEQCSECRAFVVRRSASAVNPAVIAKGKRLLPPFRLLSRLHVQMIVHRYGWMLAAGCPPRRHDGVSAGLDDLGLRSGLSQHLLSEVGHAPHVLRS